MAPGNPENASKLSERPKRSKLDWGLYRQKSLLPGGFGAERAEIWPKFLNVKESKGLFGKEKWLSEPEAPPPHKDERQIGLDTDRSFVLYPVDPRVNRDSLQTELNQLLVALFRKRPRLSYFQGFHDIVTVFYLTLPEEFHLAAVEKLSLHRLRDAMGLGLEPVLGLLRVVKNLLRLEDPEYSHVLEQSAPLPFFALSNLLTLFAHDVPTLPLIQHVFDYLLCRPPVASVYLACAVILSRKKDAFRLAEEDEDGMIHSLLSSLPTLSDGAPDSSELDSSVSTALLNDVSSSLEMSPSSIPPEVETLSEKTSSISDQTSEPLESSRISDEENEPRNSAETVSDDEHQSSLPLDESQRLTEDDPSRLPARTVESHGASTPLKNGDLPGTEHVQNTGVSALIEKATLVTQSKRVEEPSIDLVDLLKQADALYSKFPPSHSDLHLSSILGPQSVVFTWSDNFSDLPSDDEAEAMVQHPELVVYPYIDVPEPSKEEYSHTEDEGDESESTGLWGLRRRRGKEKVIATNSAIKRRLKKRFRKSPFSHLEKRTMVAGTVLVLGVAVAIYGIQTQSNGSGGLSFTFADVQEAGTQAAYVAGLGGWAAGMFSSMSQRILDGLAGKERI